MTVQWSGAVRNAVLDAWETAIGASAKLQIWTGAPPANCAAASTGTQLVEYALGADWAAAAGSGAKALSSLPLSVAALASGTAGYYRITDTAETTCHEQGTITATGGGGDMTIDNTSIAVGQTVQVTGFTKTAPGA
jgi:hypothetical protein